MVDEAVTATLEMHVHLSLAIRGSYPEGLVTESPVAGASYRNLPQSDGVTDILQQLFTRTERMEATLYNTGAQGWET